MTTYTTAEGEVLDLNNLTPEQQAFFDRCLEAYRSGADGVTIARMLENTVDNPLIRDAGGMITLVVVRHPLYHAVGDLEYRAFLCEREPDPEVCRQRCGDPLDDAWIPVASAAEVKGISVQGLHKAIKRGEVIARRFRQGEARLVVSRNSLKHWQPNASRQAAGKRIPAPA